MSPTVLLTNFGIILSSSSIGNTNIFTSILRLGFGIFRHCFLFDDERKVISIYDAFMTRSMLFGFQSFVPSFGVLPFSNF